MDRFEKGIQERIDYVIMLIEERKNSGLDTAEDYKALNAYIISLDLYRKCRSEKSDKPIITEEVEYCSSCSFCSMDNTAEDSCHFPNNKVDYRDIRDFGDNGFPSNCPLDEKSILVKKK